MLVKVGPKQRHLEVPEGWYRVSHGDAQPGDQFANLMTGKWQEVEEDDIGYNYECFDHLIRKM